MKGLDSEGDLFANYILLVSLSFDFVFSNGIFTSPQLWGDFTAVVGKVHHSCGVITIKGIKTTFLLKKTTFKEEKTGVVFGCFCWKWVARGDNFASEKA